MKMLQSISGFFCLAAVVLCVSSCSTSPSGEPSSVPERSSNIAEHQITSPDSSGCTIPEGPPTLTALYTSDDHCDWKIAVSGKPCPGTTVTLTITGKPDAGWHLYSSDDSGDDIVYLPANIELDEMPNSGAELSGKMKDLTTPKTEYDDILEGTIRHFANGQEVSFSQQILIQNSAPCMEGEFRAQLCQDDGQCIPIKRKLQWHPSAAECK